MTVNELNKKLGIDCILSRASEIEKNFKGSDEVHLLTKCECLCVCNKYLNGIVSEFDLMRWASTVQFSDAYDYEDWEDRIIANFLHALATPEIDGRSAGGIIEEFKTSIN